VPFFLFEGKYAVSGAQPTESFGQALRQVWDLTHPGVGELGSADGPVCGPDGC